MIKSRRGEGGEMGGGGSGDGGGGISGSGSELKSVGGVSKTKKI